MKSYVFYDDTADYEAYDDVRAYLFDMYGEDNGWETADEVPDNWVYDEISEQNNADWRELLHALGLVRQMVRPRAGRQVHQQYR